MKKAARFPYEGGEAKAGKAGAQMTITVTEASAAVSAVGLLSGLIGAYVGVQNRALLAEVRKELAELENRIILRMNGTHVRSAECMLRHQNLQTRMETLAGELRGAAKHEEGA